MTIMGVVGCHIQTAYSEEASFLRQKRQEKETTTEGGYEKITFSCTLSREDTADHVNYYTFSENYDLIESPSIPTNCFYFKTEIVGQDYTSFRWALVNGLNTIGEFPNFILLNNGGRWIKDGNTGYRDIDIVLISFGATYSHYSSNPSASITLTFQDIASYYKEQGYSEGRTDGYGSGYEAGYQDGTEATLLFTDLGCNQKRWYLTDLTASDSTDTTTTYKLLTYKDGNNTTHSVWGTRYATDDSFIVRDYAGATPSSQYSHVQIGTGTWFYSQSEGWYCNVVPNNYVHHDFAQVTGVFNNSIPFNYFMLSGLPANATGYQQGYNNGYRDGLNSTAAGLALDNVFGLFSKAFGSVASFFNLKVFGFLPLYWFFLVPIFIAIITLLLRMVKH